MAKLVKKVATTNTTTTPTISPILGVVLSLNGSPVSLNGAIGDIKTKGIDMAITEPAVLGTFGDMFTYIGTEFGITMPATADMPKPVADIIAKVEGLKVTILKAHLHIAGSSETDQNNYYTLVMSVNEADGSAIVSLGPLSLMGAVVGVTNEGQTATS